MGGIDELNPAVHNYLRGDGEAGALGWPRSPGTETLRTQWVAAPDLAQGRADALSLI